MLKHRDAHILKIHGEGPWGFYQTSRGRVYRGRKIFFGKDKVPYSSFMKISEARPNSTYPPPPRPPVCGCVLKRHKHCGNMFVSSYNWNWHKKFHLFYNKLDNCVPCESCNYFPPNSKYRKIIRMLSFYVSLTSVKNASNWAKLSSSFLQTLMIIWRNIATPPVLIVN